MHSICAAAWVDREPETLKALRQLLEQKRHDQCEFCIVLFHDADCEKLRFNAPLFLDLKPAPRIIWIGVKEYPRAAQKEQNRSHSLYPDTILSPSASASKRLENLLLSWASELGSPGTLIVTSTDGLPYFSFHRAWREPHFLESTELVLLETESRLKCVNRAGHPKCRRDHYWINRMEQFCRKAADTIMVMETGDLLQRSEAKDRRGKSIFPLIEGQAVGVNADARHVKNLSVIIPYYNMGKWLSDAVDSVLSSSYMPAEVLILNDGSDDRRSIDVLRTVSQTSEIIRVIDQENRGLGRTRIRGAEEAVGDAIFFLDADDRVDPLFFEKAVFVLNRFQNISMVTAWEQYFGDIAKVWPKWDVDIPWMLGKNMTTPMVVVRRRAWLDSVCWSSEFKQNYEDYDAWLSLLSRGHHLLCIPEVLLFHRIRRGSRWDRRTGTQLRRLKQSLIQKHAALYRHHAVELAGLLAANGPADSWDTPCAFHDAKLVFSRGDASR